MDQYSWMANEGKGKFFVLLCCWPHLKDYNANFSRKAAVPGTLKINWFRNYFVQYQVVILTETQNAALVRIWKILVVRDCWVSLEHLTFQLFKVADWIFEHFLNNQNIPDLTPEFGKFIHDDAKKMYKLLCTLPGTSTIISSLIYNTIQFWMIVTFCTVVSFGPQDFFVDVRSIWSTLMKKF
jgi:hypothetical protein